MKLLNPFPTGSSLVIILVLLCAHCHCHKKLFFGHKFGGGQGEIHNHYAAIPYPVQQPPQILPVPVPIHEHHPPQYVPVPVPVHEHHPHYVPVPIVVQSYAQAWPSSSGWPMGGKSGWSSGIGGGDGWPSYGGDFGGFQSFGGHSYGSSASSIGGWQGGGFDQGFGWGKR